MTAILGNNPLLWWYPHTATGTGLKYPVAEGTSKWVEFSRNDGYENRREGGGAVAQNGLIAEGRETEHEIRARKMGAGGVVDGAHMREETDGEMVEDMV